MKKKFSLTFPQTILFSCVIIFIYIVMHRIARGTSDFDHFATYSGKTIQSIYQTGEGKILIRVDDARTLIITPGRYKLFVKDNGQYK